MTGGNTNRTLNTINNFMTFTPTFIIIIKFHLMNL
jgi:hypothetical protein